MTAKLEHYNFPKSVEDAQNHKDFDVFISSQVLDTIHHFANAHNLSKKFSDMYVSILNTSYITIDIDTDPSLYSESLLNISGGMPTLVRIHKKNENNRNFIGRDIHNFALNNDLVHQVISSSRLLYICQHGCFSPLEFFGQEEFVRKPLNPESLF
ncbi:unnamed protein product, partial [Orchesella dallaii]